ncbi:MAG: hypothetical protein L0Y54_05475 [Sporichthyaceae bacterium]|nr:hypothetical protein [Sporichthyaceae bacterium]
MPRQRSRTRALVGVLVLLAGGLGAMLLVSAAGGRVAGVAVTARVAAGEPVPADAIGRIEVAPAAGVEFVRWEQRSELAGLYARTELLPGMVLVAGMVTGDAPVRDGRVVGLSLGEGRFPEELAVGDRVDVVQTGTGMTLAGSGVLAREVRVYSISDLGDALPGSERAVSLLVPEDQAMAVAQAAAAGDVVLTVIPGGG